MTLAPRESASMSAAILDLGQGQRPSASTLFSSIAASTTVGLGAIGPRVRNRKSSQFSSIRSRTGVPAAKRDMTTAIVPSVSHTGSSSTDLSCEGVIRRRSGRRFIGDATRHLSIRHGTHPAMNSSRGRFSNRKAVTDDYGSDTDTRANSMRVGCSVGLRTSVSKKLNFLSVRFVPPIAMNP